MLRPWSLLLLISTALAAGPRLDNAPRPVIEDKIKDLFVPAPLDQQRLGGLLGERIRLNLDSRLLAADETALLGGFQNRSLASPRAGEHVGKFLDAASLAWAYSGHERLKTVLDRVAAALIASQLPDGYLGTYPEDQRWTRWDVSVHSHVLAGLLSYYQVTGHRPALEAARKIGDLLTRTFGPTQRDLIKSGAHLGLAATGVLEPVCLLHRHTGQERRLADYILRAYEQPDGPHLLRSFSRTGSVFKTADANAYQILSNLVALLDLYRLSGDDTLLKAAQTAWKDIVSKRLYLTGTTSAGEYFKDDLSLPGYESAQVGEACVTVSWLRLNWQLLRLTGETPYADQIERTVYNHLLASQDPRDGAVCPSPPLEGRKRAERTLTCCVSSESRGLALIPQMVWGAREGGVAVVLYAPGEASIPLVMAGGTLEVGLTSQTRFPLDGSVSLTLKPARRARFPLFLRVPSWCRRFTATLAGATTPGKPGEFLRLDRTWQAGDRIQIDMEMSGQVLPGAASYPEHVAIQRGPQVLALEAAVNSGIPFLHRVAPVSASEVQLADAAVRLPKGWIGNQAYAIAGMATQRTPEGKQTVGQKELLLVPFADARRYRVWLIKPDKIPFGPVAVTAFGLETFSRAGNIDGSICDERPDTFRVTFEGAPARQDWYAVEMDAPELIARVVYRHGRVFQNGGWFNTVGGKPVVQLKRTRTGNWETVGPLDSYPETTSKDIPNLRDGQPFEVRLKEPLKVVGVRVLGRPGAFFSSCAELAAYGP